jgi:hypothetical protein
LGIELLQNLSCIFKIFEYNNIEILRFLELNMCDCVDKVIVKRIFEVMNETIKKQQNDIAELNKRLKKLEDMQNHKEKMDKYSEDVFYNYNWDNEVRNG